MRMHLERGYAQSIRAGRGQGPSWESAAQRASFWARLQSQVAQENEQRLNQDVAEISQGSPKSQIQFQTANIHSATLESTAPQMPGAATTAGISESGFVPPPPPAA